MPGERPASPRQGAVRIRSGPAPGSPYEAVDSGAEASSIWSFRRFVRGGLARAPGARSRFRGALASALRTAMRTGEGFYLNVADARAALGSELLIRLDPSKLASRLMERCKLNGRPIGFGDSFLGAGNWSPLLMPIHKTPSFWEMKLIHAAGLDYEKTLCFERYVARAKAGDPVKRNHVVLDSLPRIHAYLGQSAALLRSVADHGVMPRRQWKLREPGRRPRDILLEASEQEVGVAIGPRGEVYRFCAGKHRTAAAILLKVSAMPVEVRMVHATWLAERQAETGGDPLAALVEGVRDLDVAGV